MPIKPNPKQWFLSCNSEFTAVVVTDSLDKDHFSVALEQAMDHESHIPVLTGNRYARSYYVPMNIYS